MGSNALPAVVIRINQVVVNVVFVGVVVFVGAVEYMGGNAEAIASERERVRIEIVIPCK